MNQQYIIKKAWILSILGLLPFAWATAEIWLGMTQSLFFVAPPAFVFICYSAVILSFLGGVMWGFALQLQGRSNLAAWLLAFSVVPSLIAWLAVLLFAQNISWLLLLGGFLCLLKIEHFMLQIDLIAPWFWLLRRNITVAVVTLILLNWCYSMQ